MTRYLAVLGLLCLTIVLNAQKSNKSGAAVDSKLSAGAALLFKSVSTSSTVAEKNRLYQQLNLKLSPDGKSFILDDFPVNVYVYPTDMNKDGREEFFIGLESSALFGNIGESYNVYIKEKSGAYQHQPDFYGGRPMILSTANLGYPDLLAGGPGFEHPVFRWNGRTYMMHRKMKDGAITGKNATDVELYSKSYSSGR